MHIKGNTKTNRKWWVTLGSAFYLSFFYHTLSILLKNQHQMPNRENSQKFIHQQYQYQMSKLNESQSVSCPLQRSRGLKQYAQITTYKITHEKCLCAPKSRSYE